MCVFAVELRGKSIQTPAESVLVDLHQLLPLRCQLHTNAKLTFPGNINR